MSDQAPFEERDIQAAWKDGYETRLEEELTYHQERLEYHRQKMNIHRNEVRRLKKELST